MQHYAARFTSEYASGEDFFGETPSDKDEIVEAVATRGRFQRVGTKKKKKTAQVCFLDPFPYM